MSDAIDPGGLPRYAWGWFEGNLYEARHLSSPADGYKAYPIARSELPEGAWEMLQETPRDD